jgi:hypothetical protein
LLLIISLGLALIFSLAACGAPAKEASAAMRAPASSDAPTEPTAAPTKPDILSVSFSNSTDYIFNEIYISPTATNEWGDELLGSTRVLKSNGSIEVDVPAYDYDNYDIRVVDEERDVYQFTYVPLKRGNRLEIVFDEGLKANVYDPGGAETASVAGSLNGGGEPDAASLNEGESEAASGQIAVGAGHDSNGQYSFTVYNESSYDIYSIHMGLLSASAADDIDMLPQVLPAGENIEISGVAEESVWSETEWTLRITDVDGDVSASFDTFNPWTVSYVDVKWDGESGGYVCEFFY